jgi:hypothetical protein
MSGSGGQQAQALLPVHLSRHLFTRSAAEASAGTVNAVQADPFVGLAQLDLRALAEPGRDSLAGRAAIRLDPAALSALQAAAQKEYQLAIENHQRQQHQQQQQQQQQQAAEAATAAATAVEGKEGKRKPAAAGKPSASAAAPAAAATPSKDSSAESKSRSTTPTPGDSAAGVPAKKERKSKKGICRSPVCLVC